MAQSGKVIERAADLVLIVVSLTMLGVYLAGRPAGRPFYSGDTGVSAEELAK